jgi:hypothetical protein
MLMCCNGGPGLPVSASYLNEVTREASSGRFKASCISSPVSQGLQVTPTTVVRVSFVGLR